MNEQIGEIVYVAASVTHDPLVTSMRPTAYRGLGGHIRWQVDPKDEFTFLASFDELRKMNLHSPLCGHCNAVIAINIKK